MAVLCLKTPVTRFSNPCFRPNLFYDVIFDDVIENSYNHLIEFIDQCLMEENVNINPVRQFKFNMYLKQLPIVF